MYYRIEEIPEDVYKRQIQYRHILPVEKMFTWKDCHHFLKGHYILMHSVIFRTRLLQECGLKLPEHTFYVDNLYVFEPLPYVKNMYYLDVNFYSYYIGRQDQSVNETVMISRIDQQIRVTKLMIDYLVGRKSELVKNRRLYQYMRNYLEIIMTVSSVLLIRSGTTEHLEKKKELWEYLKGKDKRLYLWMRNGIMGGTMNLSLIHISTGHLPCSTSGNAQRKEHSLRTMVFLPTGGAYGESWQSHVGYHEDERKL